MLGSPVPGKQVIMEITLPGNTDTQRKVRTRQAKPPQDEAKDFFWALALLSTK